MAAGADPTLTETVSGRGVPLRRARPHVDRACDALTEADTALERAIEMSFTVNSDVTTSPVASDRIAGGIVSSPGRSVVSRVGTIRSMLQDRRPVLVSRG